MKPAVKDRWSDIREQRAWRDGEQATENSLKTDRLPPNAEESTERQRARVRKRGWMEVMRRGAFECCQRRRTPPITDGHKDRVHHGGSAF